MAIQSSNFLMNGGAGDTVLESENGKNKIVINNQGITITGGITVQSGSAQNLQKSGIRIMRHQPLTWEDCLHNFFIFPFLFFTKQLSNK